MGFWLFLLLLVLIGWGIYFCHRLKQIEADIRKDLEATEIDEDSPVDGDEEIVRETSGAYGSAVSDAESDPVGQILTLVGNEPGIKQTEVYSRLSDVPRKSIQELLRKLADDGRIRREKKGSSYQLYPT